MSGMGLLLVLTSWLFSHPTRKLLSDQEPVAFEQHCRALGGPHAPTGFTQYQQNPFPADCKVSRLLYASMLTGGATTRRSILEVVAWQ